MKFYGVIRAYFLAAETANAFVVIKMEFPVRIQNDGMGGTNFFTFSASNAQVGILNRSRNKKAFRENIKKSRDQVKRVKMRYIKIIKGKGFWRIVGKKDTGAADNKVSPLCGSV